MKRLRAALLMTGLIVAVAVVAWLAGREAANPEQAAAPDPPGLSILAVPVETLRLEKTVVARGTVEFGPAASIALGPTETVGRGIVTMAARPGEVIEDGQVVFEVDGRPVMVFEGERPSFRNLTRGVAGPDVLQLEEALVRAGLDPGEVDGVFDRTTETGLLGLYVTAGYEPPLSGSLSVSRRAEVTDLWNQVSQKDDTACQVPGATGACPLLDQLVETYRNSGLAVEVPFPEVLFVSELPAVIASGSPILGDAVATAVLELASVEATVNPVVPRSDAVLMTIGDEVTVDDEVTGRTASGSIVDLMISEEGGGEAAVIHILLDQSGVELVGRSVRVRVPIEATADEVTAVPVAALHSDTNGRTWIELVTEDDQTEWVEVTPGLEAGGLVEVDPVDHPILSGAWVVVGQRDGP